MVGEEDSVCSAGVMKGGIEELRAVAAVARRRACERARERGHEKEHDNERGGGKERDLRLMSRRGERGTWSELASDLRKAGE